VHASGFSSNGSSSSDFVDGRSCGRQWDGRRAACTRARWDRAWSAAARRRRRGERPGLAAVGVRGGRAAWRLQRWTPASACACALYVGCAHVGRVQCSMEVAWQRLCTPARVPRALGRACVISAAATRSDARHGMRDRWLLCLCCASAVIRVRCDIL
jgi:hypothetical protein